MLLSNEQFREIEACLEALQPSRLTLNKWESEFLTSIADQFARRGTLSERQIETLKKLYEEKG